MRERCEFCNQRRAGGRDPFSCARRGAGWGFGGGQQFQRGRRGIGNLAVFRFAPAQTQRQRPGIELFDAQFVQTGAGANDVDDGVDRADFVEVDLVARGAAGRGPRPSATLAR